MTAPITQECFEAFLKCPTKSYLVSKGAVGDQSEFREWQRRLQEEYNEAASAHLRSSLQRNEWYIGTLPSEQLSERRYRLIFEFEVAGPEAHARLDALELDRSPGRAAHYSYIPVRFVRLSFLDFLRSGQSDVDDFSG